MKQFQVPTSYRSSLITHIKQKRKTADKLKKDFTPTELDLGPLRFYLARHFGFCYGVENAIEIAFKTIDENKGKRIFLLSEMIHNPLVNEDLLKRGVRFLMDTKGNELIPFDQLVPEDIVIVPAFGTTLDIEEKLRSSGILIKNYNTTCPFVEKVWNRAESIAANNYSIIIHGKPDHEETRATFSHSAASAPSVIVKDMHETIELAKYISGEKEPALFYEEFSGQYSKDFDVTRHLERIGVVNQTTMLASDTEAIAKYLRDVMVRKYGNEENIELHFADTRDTLCYATYENQEAVSAMLNKPADLAIVVGGYNSSNTSHLVELCEEKLPTYHIDSANKIISAEIIRHFDFRKGIEESDTGFLPVKRPLTIMITSGASCPDAVVEEVMQRITEVLHLGEVFKNLIKTFE